MDVRVDAQRLRLRGLDVDVPRGRVQDSMVLAEVRVRVRVRARVRARVRG